MSGKVPYEPFEPVFNDMKSYCEGFPKDTSKKYLIYTKYHGFLIGKVNDDPSVVRGYPNNKSFYWKTDDISLLEEQIMAWREIL